MNLTNEQRTALYQHLLQHPFKLDDGVPSLDLFEGYVSFLEKKHSIKIDEIMFRDKSKGWDLKGSILFTKNNKQYRKFFKTGASSYYTLFLQSQTYRESCYECPYAGKLRSGDITIGDFWGLEQEHPEYLKRNGGAFDEKKGVSCLIINSKKGQALVEKFGIGLNLKKTNFMCISKNNAQLRAPSRRGNERDLVLNIFNNQGYEQLDKWYHARLGFRKIIYMLYDLIPANREKIM